jgi:hypothetical protein
LKKKKKKVKELQKVEAEKEEKIAQLENEKGSDSDKEDDGLLEFQINFAKSEFDYEVAAQKANYEVKVARLKRKLTQAEDAVAEALSRKKENTSTIEQNLEKAAYEEKTKELTQKNNDLTKENTNLKRDIKKDQTKSRKTKKALEQVTKRTAEIERMIEEEKKKS